jgi:excisionase family DNA binding protein
MDLLTRLAALCDASPPGTLIQLPVDWLREELAKQGEPGHSGTEREPEPQADLTVEEVAEIVGRKAGTVRDWIRQERLRAYLFNDREYRIPRAALQEYLDAQRGADKSGAGAATKKSARGKAPNLGAWRELRRAS